MIFILERTIQGFMGYRSFLISITAAFFLGIVLIPLKNIIQNLVDRYFLKGTPQQLAKQLEQLKQEVAQTERYKTLSTISSGVAHEIKNPLTALKTFAEYLPHKLEDKEFLKKFSKIVGSEVDRIDDMIHQLLDYGKPAPPSLRETDVHKLLNDTLDILNSQFVNKHITLGKDYESKNPFILAIDPNQMKQAFLNILINAIEAMPNGGKLIVKTRAQGLGGQRVKGNPSPPQTLNPFNPLTLEISIQDTGCGISEKNLSLIFDPFFTSKDDSTGLGLAITQGIIENHKGKIKVRSKVGVGTQVEIVLPI
jgi:signal transduction histidine kinase